MAAWRSATERKTPRFSRRRESLAKKPSIAFSHEHEVGEMEGPARMTAEPGADLRVLMGGVIVENGVDDLASRDVALETVEEANELLVPVVLHVAADHRAVEHVERSEQR